MKALWLEEQKLSYREDAHEEKLSPGEVRVRVRMAGICGTDLELLRGYYPFTGIPGHEFVGEVVEIAGEGNRADTQGIRVGTRVVGEINISCGECPPCRRGDRGHCDVRRVLGIKGWDGAFAERLVLPLENLHPVSDGVPDEAAVFVEPLAAALGILDLVHVDPTDRVLVIGAGRLGQLVTQVLYLSGCNLQVVARHPAQRERLEERGIVWLREDQIPSRQADVVVEATGSSAGFDLARDAVRPRGTIVLKSTYQGEMSVNFSSIVVDEVRLVGSRCGAFPPALRLLERGLIDPLPLFGAVYPLEQGLAAFDQAARPGALKVILK